MFLRNCLNAFDFSFNNASLPFVVTLSRLWSDPFWTTREIFSKMICETNESDVFKWTNYVNNIIIFKKNFRHSILVRLVIALELYFEYSSKKKNALDLLQCPIRFQATRRHLWPIDKNLTCFCAPDNISEKYTTLLLSNKYNCFVIYFVIKPLNKKIFKNIWNKFIVISIYVSFCVFLRINVYWFKCVKSISNISIRESNNQSLCFSNNF